MTPRQSQLSAVIERLFEASRTDGRQRAHTTEKGLKITVATHPDVLIALSRERSMPGTDEAAIVAQHAGWGSLYNAGWENVGGVRYLVLRPDYSEPLADDDPPVYIDAPAAASPPPEPPDPDARLEAIRRLLLAPGPWREDSLSLRGPPEARERLVANFRPCQLEDFHAWISGKYPDAYQEFAQRHPELRHLPFAS